MADFINQCLNAPTDSLCMGVTVFNAAATGALVFLVLMFKNAWWSRLAASVALIPIVTLGIVIKIGSFRLPHDEAHWVVDRIVFSETLAAVGIPLIGLIYCCKGGTDESS